MLDSRAHLTVNATNWRNNKEKLIITRIINHKHWNYNYSDTRALQAGQYNHNPENGCQNFNTFIKDLLIKYNVIDDISSAQQTHFICKAIRMQSFIFWKL